MAAVAHGIGEKSSAVQLMAFWENILEFVC